MPGLAGLITSRPAQEAEELASRMVVAMGTDEGLEVVRFQYPGASVFGGITRLAGTGQTCEFSRESADWAGDRVLLYGELFPNSNGLEHGAGYGSILDAILSSRDSSIETRRFLQSLNGLFSGVIVDDREGRVDVFVDRFGFERLYVHDAGDAYFFASEVKAILAVAPETREFDDEGVAQFLATGCTFGGVTLFRGIQILPGAAHIRFRRGERQFSKTYFSPGDEWEPQDPLSEGEFLDRLDARLKVAIPAYSDWDGPLGISLTAGLDSRMLLACVDGDPSRFVSFTYSGETIDSLDATIASKVAAVLGIEHHILRVEEDFFDNFARHAEETVKATDGYFGVTGAHERYMSSKARQLAPVRLTGNYGSEILRGVSTFKVGKWVEGLIDGDFRSHVAKVQGQFASLPSHPVTFAAFAEVPFNLWGNYAAGRSRIGFRTPYLDNELVKLAYRGPRNRDAAVRVATEIVRRNRPELAAILSDRGYFGYCSRLASRSRYAYERLTFKLDYIYNEGFPTSLTRFEAAYRLALRAGRLLGRHKHLHYRDWFRRRLGGFVWETVNDPNVSDLPYWEKGTGVRLAEAHLAGKANHVAQLDAVMTLGLVNKLLIKGGGWGATLRIRS